MIMVLKAYYMTQAQQNKENASSLSLFTIINHEANTDISTALSPRHIILYTLQNPPRQEEEETRAQERQISHIHHYESDRCTADTNVLP